MGQVTLYSSDDDEKEVTANLGAGYDIMLDNLEDRFDSEDEMINELCRVIEATIYQEAQQQNEGPELHSAFAELIRVLDKRGEVNIQKLTENSVHQLTQMTE